MTYERFKELPPEAWAMWRDIESGSILGRSSSQYQEALARADRKSAWEGLDVYLFDVGHAQDGAEGVEVCVVVHRASGTIVNCGVQVFVD